MHECMLSSVFRLGHAKAAQGFFDERDEPGTFRSWTSGWMRNRIKEWADMHECPMSDQWVVSSSTDVEISA